MDFLLIFNLPAPAADKSLAIPLTPKQSGLLGVIDKSITFSEVFLKYFSPILFAYLLFFNSIIPSLSLDNCNSDSEQSIPYDVTPLILLTDNFIRFLGIIDPGGA